MKINPYQNIGFGSVSNANNTNNVARNQQTNLSTPIRDTVSFRSKEQNKQHEKPFGAEVGQFLGGLMNGLPNVFDKKSVSEVPAAERLKETNPSKAANEQNIYKF